MILLYLYYKIINYASINISYTYAINEKIEIAVTTIGYKIFKKSVQNFISLEHSFFS